MAKFSPAIFLIAPKDGNLCLKGRYFPIKKLQLAQSIPIGHGCVLQVVVSVEFPTQSWPPLEGAGFVQFLDLVIVPPAHVTPQGLHADHSVQLPSEINQESKSSCSF